MRSSDPSGYYAALKISPDAGAAEIRLAYEFLKKSYHEERKQLDIGKIREAYKTLGDPKSRKEYDLSANRKGSMATRRMPQVDGFKVLVGALVVGLVVLAFIVGPDLKAHFTHYESGDQLVWSVTGKPLGTVVSYVAAHTFPSGVSAAAYKIEPADGTPPKWFPAGDLKRHCKKKR